MPRIIPPGLRRVSSPHRSRIAPGQHPENYLVAFPIERNTDRAVLVLEEQPAVPGEQHRHDATHRFAGGHVPDAGHRCVFGGAAPENIVSGSSPSRAATTLHSLWFPTR